MRTALADLRAKQGDLDTAMAELGSVLHVRHEVLGPDHPEILRADTRFSDAKDTKTREPCSPITPTSSRTGTDFSERTACRSERPQGARTMPSSRRRHRRSHRHCNRGHRTIPADPGPRPPRHPSHRRIRQRSANRLIGTNWRRADRCHPNAEAARDRQQISAAATHADASGPPGAAANRTKSRHARRNPRDDIADVLVAIKKLKSKLDAPSAQQQKSPLLQPSDWSHPSEKESVYRGP
ncbi:tetratricopeptide repeat protein [Nocardia sp. NPDC050378]|uniref:tetratricopeptide repeat protein n=1 Tax=Nocardia sp. NPDC050378 TaxID=3155400 RepID=UPI0033D6B787